MRSSSNASCAVCLSVEIRGGEKVGNVAGSVMCLEGGQPTVAAAHGETVGQRLVLRSLRARARNSTRPSWKATHKNAQAQQREGSLSGVCTATSASGAAKRVVHVPMGRIVYSSASS